MTKKTKLLVMDFETVDPFLSKQINLGPGWAYELEKGFEVPDTADKIDRTKIKNLAFPITISYGIIEEEKLGKVGTLRITKEDMVVLNSLLEDCEHNVIAHNAQYELGYLKLLGIDIEKLNVIDTKSTAFLYNSNEESTGLGNLSDKYLKKESSKDANILVEVVKKHKLITMKPDRKTFPRAALNYAYGNMDTIYNIDYLSLKNYAEQDIYATAGLFFLHKKTISIETMFYWGNILKILVKMRARGIVVDMDRLRESLKKMEPIVKSLEADIHKLAGKVFNVNSPAQLLEVFNLKTTERKFLEKNAHNPVCKAILEYRLANKLYNDFLIKTRDMQQYTCPEAFCGSNYGKVFPHINLFGARTGRFSAQYPNIQQSPKNSEIYGNIFREIFVPSNKDNKWYSLDWANQEGRLQLHFAASIGAPTSDIYVKLYKENPEFDMHQQVADMMGRTRKEAKIINLGLSYGMAKLTLCKNLGLPTKYIINFKGKRIETMGDECEELYNAYQEASPWLDFLNKKAMGTLKTRGELYTLGNRALKREHLNGEFFDYKALNKLIQGSAADQMAHALTEADKKGADIICIVHDEINVEGEESAKIVKGVMEEEQLFGKTLQVPMVAEMKSGPSWGDLK